MANEHVNPNPFTQLAQHKARLEGPLKRREELLITATAIARKKGWQAEDMDALYALFAEKFQWTPAQVRALTLEELGMFVENFFQK